MDVTLRLAAGLGQGDEDPLTREGLEQRLGQSEVLRQERLGDVAEPVGDAERAELGEIPVVEDQDEVTGLAAEAAEPMKPRREKVDMTPLGRSKG